MNFLKLTSSIFAVLVTCCNFVHSIWVGCMRCFSCQSVHSRFTCLMILFRRSLVGLLQALVLLLMMGLVKSCVCERCHHQFEPGWSFASCVLLPKTVFIIFWMEIRDISHWLLFVHFFYSRFVSFVFWNLGRSLAKGQVISFRFDARKLIGCLPSPLFHALTF